MDSEASKAYVRDAAKRLQVIQAALELALADIQALADSNPVVRLAIDENKRRDSTHAKFFEPG